MLTDPIADYLTRIRNAIKAKHKIVEIPASNIKKDITKVLFDKGYIKNYKFEDSSSQNIGRPKSIHNSIKIALKYDSLTKRSAIVSLVRVSKPGYRKYVSKDNMPRVLNGLGIAILTTSKGVMSDKEARKLNIGGEFLCYVY